MYVAKVRQKMRIHSIEIGFFSTDGGAMFGVVPRRVWSRKYTAGLDNRCALTMRALYAEMPNHKVLFDVGLGEAVVDGMDYYQFHQLKSLTKELEALNCQAHEVTDVVLSHLHFDHCGGAVRCLDSGEWVPSFPNATYWVSKRQWALAQNPSAWEADSYVPERIRVLESKGLLRLVEADGPLFDGVSVQLYQGHTEGQLVSWVHLDDALYVVPSDVLPMELHVLPLCIAAVDCSAQVSMDEKARLLDAVVEKKAWVFLYHDTQTQAIRLKKKNGTISVAERLMRK